MGLTVIEEYIVRNHKKQPNDIMAVNIGITEAKLIYIKYNLRKQGYLKPLNINVTEELIPGLIQIAQQDKQPLIKLMAKQKLEDIFKSYES